MPVRFGRLPARPSRNTLWLSELDDPLYKVRVVRCVGPEAEFVAEANRVHPEEPLLVVRHADARTLVANTPEGYQRLWFWLNGEAHRNQPPSRIAGIMAHEAVHGASGVFEMIGLTTDRTSEEALTYYVEWLARTTLAYFWRE